MRSPLSFLTLLFSTIAFLPLLSSALHFYLDASENKCFLEELPVDTIVEGSSCLLFHWLVYKVEVLILWGAVCVWRVGHYSAFEWSDEAQGTRVLFPTSPPAVRTLY